MKDNNLNICLMNDSFPPLIDGVSNTVQNYANILTNMGHDVTVAVPNFPNAFDSYNYNVLRYKSFPTTKLVGYRTGYPFSASLLNELENKNLDILHSHCPFASTILGRVARERIDIPLIMTYHTKFDIDIERVLKNKLATDTVVKAVVENISSCDEIWAVSNGAAENLREIGYNGDIYIMKNGVDFPKGESREKEIEQILLKYKINKTKPIYLFVGRLRWYKGVKIILEGLAKLKKIGRDFTMIFIGKGEDQEEMENYAKELGIYEKCLFVGAIYDRNELRRFYSLSDLFLFPSSYDTFGLVVVEAAACKTPSILIKNSAAAENVKDGINGWTIDENAESMFNCLSQIGNKMDLLKNAGEKAYETLYFSWEDSLKEAYERYLIVIDKYKSGETHRKFKTIDEFYNAIGKICEEITVSREIRNNIMEVLLK